jgi:hypothetical protein
VPDEPHRVGIAERNDLAVEGVQLDQLPGGTLVRLGARLRRLSPCAAEAVLTATATQVTPPSFPAALAKWSQYILLENLPVPLFIIRFPLRSWFLGRYCLPPLSGGRRSRPVGSTRIALGSGCSSKNTKLVPMARWKCFLCRELRVQLCFVLARISPRTSLGRVSVGAPKHASS